MKTVKTQKKNVIFGAGQAGAMVNTWLPANCPILCYADNDPDKQGKFFMGYPVLSLREALKDHPDMIWIAALNSSAVDSIRMQIEETGFSGEVLSVLDFRDRQDIRLSTMRLIAREIIEKNITGAVAELGVFQGAFSAEINRILPDRRLYLFDTFQGFDERDLIIERTVSNGKEAWHPDFTDTSVEAVRERLPHPEMAQFVKGFFPDSIENVPEAANESFCLVSLDPDLYEPVKMGLEFFFPRMSKGGIILIHDYNSMQFPGVGKAVREFCDNNDLFCIPLSDLHGTAVLIK